MGAEDKDLTQEGTITFCLAGSPQEWQNQQHHAFPAVERGPIRVDTTKNSDGTITIAIAGPFGGRYDFRAFIPNTPADGLHVAVVWKAREVTLFLAGQRIQKRTSPRSKL